MFGMRFGAAASGYKALAVNFDGATHLDRGGALTGATDGKEFTLSGWFNIDSTNEKVIYDTASTGLDIRLLSGGKLQIESVASGSPTLALSGSSVSAIASAGSWFHLAIAIDMNNTSNRHVYVNGSSVSMGYGVYSNTDLDLAGTDHSVGAAAVGSGLKFDGDMADFWWDDQYIDLSVTANRRKFISSDGKPVSLGVSGQNPTGSSPKIFLSGEAASWHTNKGTGGGFTENGTLTTASTSPSD